MTWAYFATLDSKPDEILGSAIGSKRGKEIRHLIAELALEQREAVTIRGWKTRDGLEVSYNDETGWEPKPESSIRIHRN